MDKKQLIVFSVDGFRIGFWRERGERGERNDRLISLARAVGPSLWHM